MDPSKLPTPTPTAAPTPTPVPTTPVTTVAEPVTIKPSGGSKKMIIMIAVIMIVLIAIVAGGYWYFLNQKQVSNTETKAPSVTIQADNIDIIEKDINTVNVEDPDSDITTVDTDLQSL